MRSPEAKPHKIRDRVIGSGLAVGVVGSLAWFQTHKWHEPRAEAAPHKVEKPTHVIGGVYGDERLICYRSVRRYAVGKLGIPGLVEAHRPDGDTVPLLAEIALTLEDNSKLHLIRDENNVPREARVYLPVDCQDFQKPLAEMPNTP